MAMGPGTASRNTDMEMPMPGATTECRPGPSACLSARPGPAVAGCHHASQATAPAFREPEPPANPRRFRSLADLLAAVRAQAGVISMADAGILGWDHLASLQMQWSLGIELNKVHCAAPGGAARMRTRSGCCGSTSRPRRRACQTGACSAETAMPSRASRTMIASAVCDQETAW